MVQLIASSLTDTVDGLGIKCSMKRALLFLFCATVMQAQDIFVPSEIKHSQVIAVWEAHTGPQPPMWIARYVNRVTVLNEYKVPIWAGGSTRPYRVIGWVRVAKSPDSLPPASRHSAVMKSMATTASQYKADAVLLVPGSEHQWYASGMAVQWVKPM